jgi:predicted O-linked N-acetylglucosamine transferase (SPINDLY family)
MTDQVVALWAQVLRSVPDSQLFLKAKQLGDRAIQNLTRERFAAHDIEVNRLILEGHSSRADYLAAYHRVDIALDPFPFNGATTSLEGLWMGVPLVTCSGDRLVARQGASILNNLGMASWVAADTATYAAIAAERAKDLAGLAQLRSRLRAELLASPLCDEQRFARNLEQAFRDMWQTYCAESD